jgi:predicted DNA binding CopG/RHH family protein
MNNKMQYDKEELDILEKYESGKLKRSKTIKEDIKNARKYAKNTILKSKHISIRLSEKDLKKLKIKSIETGISYQTLIGALIHQYTENKIKLKI